MGLLRVTAARYDLWVGNHDLWIGNMTFKTIQIVMWAQYLPFYEIMRLVPARDAMSCNSSKHETFTQGWSNVGPSSTTLVQHWTNLESCFLGVPRTVSWACCRLTTCGPAVRGQSHLVSVSAIAGSTAIISSTWAQQLKLSSLLYTPG